MPAAPLVRKGLSRATALAAAAAVAAGALTAAASRPASPAPAASPSSGETLALLPRDAALVASARIDRLRGRRHLLEARSRIPLFPKIWQRLDGMLAATRLELGRDFDVVTFGGRPGRGEEAGGLWVGRGRFDDSAIAAGLAGRGWKAATREGRKMLLSPSDDGLACALPGSGWILWGEPSWVAQALSLRAGKGEGALAASGRLRSLCEAAGARGEAWLVIGDPAAARQAIRRLVPDELLPAVESFARIDWLTLAARPQGPAEGPAGEGSVDLHAEAGAQDEGRSAAFADALRAVIALSKVGMADLDEETLAALRTVRVEQDGRTVRVTGRLSESLLRADGS